MLYQGGLNDVWTTNLTKKKSLETKYLDFYNYANWCHINQ